MPLKGVRYRMVPLKGGGSERLAFRGNRVVEATNMKTGATHTPAEFAADRAARRRGRRDTTRRTDRRSGR